MATEKNAVPVAVPKGFSLADFNEVKACDTLFRVVLKDADGEPISDGDGGTLGVYIIGSESKELTEFDKKTTKKVINEVWLKKNKGDKNYDKPDIDDAQEKRIARLQVMVKKWDLTDPLTTENIALFFGNNPSFERQVENANKDLRNFLPSR